MSTLHQTTERRRVTVIRGDGIGPEVVDAARRIVEAVGAPIEWEECEAGASVFKRGLKSGVPQETLDSIRRTGIVLKGPLETPVGYGEKSANVTLRKLFETYGNVRPVRQLPNLKGPYAGRPIDLVVVRENVEDLYAGIEHMQTPGVAQCLKLISRKGCEKIARLAFELARSEGRRKVHCATKANIMKHTEGLLKRTFEEVSLDYPEIEAEHIIVDNCAHQLVLQPEQFEIIVTTNMNGDILSDLTSALVGGLGLAPSANIGNEVAMFEAVHGSAPTLAGKNVANPTALILSTVMMLRHMGLFDEAITIKHAVLATLEEGKVLTGDISDSKVPATTSDFTGAIIDNLGRKATNFTTREHRPLVMPQVDPRPDTVRPERRRTVGFDLFIESDLDPVGLGTSLERLSEASPLRLKMISNRGTKVYPPNGASTDCVDHWRCRFVLRDEDGHLDDTTLLALAGRMAEYHRWMHIEKLLEFDGELGFTKAQGED